MRSPRLTILRLMVEVGFAAALFAPVGWAARHPSGEVAHTVAWALVLGWVGMLLLFRWVYRDFRNPFG